MSSEIDKLWCMAPHPLSHAPSSMYNECNAARSRCNGTEIGHE